MNTYFVMYTGKNAGSQEEAVAESLLGTITVEKESDLVESDNVRLVPVTLKFPANIMNGVSVRQALRVCYEDTDIKRVYLTSIIYVPIDTEWWKANQVRGGFDFETDHPYKRFDINTKEEVERARWWNSTMTGQTWEELALKVRRSYSDKSIKVTKLEVEAYETWG